MSLSLDSPRLRSIAVRLLEGLGPGLRSWLEFHSGHHRFFYPFGTAMNGQTARLEIVRQLIHAMKPALIVETGTFLGTTTEWLADLGYPLLSIEADERAFRFARRRLARFSNARLVLGDSAQLLAQEPPVTGPVFCYLDAHWEEHLPLGEELSAIRSRMPRAVVLIDDFAVPDDPGYGYDDYGPGKALTVEYLRACALPATARLFFPRVRSDEETGRRRGAALLTFDAELAALLDRMPLLRPWPLS